jgi:hypothetical protein
MIFMSQSGITDVQRQAEWDQWYMTHLRLMLTVDGIESAQRLKLLQGDNSPSLAIYTIASSDVFHDAYYLRIRGMGEWLPLIDQRYYRRNLFAGLDAAPDVSGTSVLLVADCEQPEPDLAGLAWHWLEAVGLDRLPPYRGLAVMPNTDLERVHGREIAIYRPVTRRFNP